MAQEEGIPYVPPADRVLSATRMGEAGPDEAGTAPSDAGELERRDAVQPGVAAKPSDDELLADCLEALRASNLPAGDRIRLSVNGSTVVARGEVESIDVLDEILGLLGEVRGVENVVDEIQVQGI